MMKTWWIFRGVLYILFYQNVISLSDEDRYSWKQAWTHFRTLSEYYCNTDEHLSPSKAFWYDLSYG